MKVLDLQCSDQHRFEGWFASEAEFQRQLQAQLLQCPLCGSNSVHKRLSAPRLSLSTSRTEASAASDSVVAPENAPAVQDQWLAALRQLVATTEDVGEKFPEEARKIHYGEAQQRGIRGRATPRQTLELLEEGITVLQLPKVLKEPLH